MGPAVAGLNSLRLGMNVKLWGWSAKGRVKNQSATVQLSLAVSNTETLAFQDSSWQDSQQGGGSDGKETTENLVLFYSSKYLHLHNIPSRSASQQVLGGDFCSQALCFLKLPQIFCAFWSPPLSIFLSSFPKCIKAPCFLYHHKQAKPSLRTYDSPVELPFILISSGFILISRQERYLSHV